MSQQRQGMPVKGTVAAGPGLLGAGGRAHAQGEPPTPVMRDVVYHTEPSDAYAGEACRLDVYRPDAARYPTVVYFHGGGLTEGSRHDAVPFAARMVREGVGVVLAGYRLSPRGTCPTYIEDAAAAVAWTLDHIGSHGGDPGRVYVSGHSAGGFLAAMVSLDPRYLDAFRRRPGELAGLAPISAQMLTHSTVRAERGIPPEQPVVDAFAPIHYVRVAAPPTLCIVGGEDLAAREEENAYFVAARRAAGHGDTRLLVVPGRDHTGVVGHLHEADDPVAGALAAFTTRAEIGP